MRTKFGIIFIFYIFYRLVSASLLLLKEVAVFHPTAAITRPNHNRNSIIRGFQRTQKRKKEAAWYNMYHLAHKQVLCFSKTWNNHLCPGSVVSSMHPLISGRALACHHEHQMTFQCACWTDPTGALDHSDNQTAAFHSQVLWIPVQSQGFLHLAECTLDLVVTVHLQSCLALKTHQTNHM